MIKDNNFFKTSMPETRKADYYLGYAEGSVFIDFNQTKNKCITIVRISFDGYGCCELNSSTVSLNIAESAEFVNEFANNELNQEIISRLVIKIIRLNKDQIWANAIEEYGLI